MYKNPKRTLKDCEEAIEKLIECEKYIKEGSEVSIQAVFRARKGRDAVFRESDPRVQECYWFNLVEVEKRLSKLLDQTIFLQGGFQEAKEKEGNREKTEIWS